MDGSWGATSDFLHPTRVDLYNTVIVREATESIPIYHLQRDPCDYCIKPLGEVPNNFYIMRARDRMLK
jgi:hypothetical protein